VLLEHGRFHAVEDGLFPIPRPQRPQRPPKHACPSRKGVFGVAEKPRAVVHGCGAHLYRWMHQHAPRLGQRRKGKEMFAASRRALRAANEAVRDVRAEFKTKGA